MMADSASKLMQRKTMWYFNWIFALGLLASVFSVLHSEIKKMPWWEVLWLRDFESLFLFLFLLTILGGVLFWQICKKAEYQNKYQDFRAAAEAFRVQFFWDIAGINESTAEHYLEEKRSVLDWIRLAVRYSIMDTLPDIRNTNSANAVDKFSFDEKVKMLREDWICDQKRYFEQSALRMTQKLTFNEKIAKILFVSGICFAFIGLGILFLHGFISLNNEYLVAIVVFFSIILPVVAGLVKYRIDKLGWIELIQHYKVMAGRFSRAEHFLDKIIPMDSYSEAQQKNIKILVHNLGVASLLENSEWLFFRRLKDIELPAK